MIDSFEKCSHDEALAYFYCDRNRLEYQDPLSVLRSMIRQLALSQSKDSIQHLIVELHTERQRSGFASEKITSSIDESQAIVLDLVKKYPQTTLIVDALDECDTRTRAQFVRVLDTLVVQSARPIKIFVSSRPDRDIKERFERGSNVEIRATDNRGDIVKFVDYEINRNEDHASWRNRIGPKLLGTICETLVDRSQGM